jgi:hypothetical protein
MKILTQSDIDRFWGKVDKEKSTTFYNGSRCWEWIASHNSDGYGNIRIGVKIEKAHRISWIISNDLLHDNLWVLHHCDNPSCVNPAHLFLGTNQDNMNDMIMKGRRHYETGGQHWTNLHPEKVARGNKSGPRVHPEAYARGEDNHFSKLTWEKVREIRRRYAWLGIGGDGARKLAKEFGVDSKTIWLIVNNKRWKE